jgi:hypothetical protein
MYRAQSHAAVLVFELSPVSRQIDNGFKLTPILHFPFFILDMFHNHDNAEIIATLSFFVILYDFVFQRIVLLIR